MSEGHSKRLKRSLRASEESPGSWECTVCTFRNQALSFKCAMCDVRKGTSTRKPRLNTTVVDQQVIVQKFVQQQAVLNVQHKEKTQRSSSDSRLSHHSRTRDTDPRHLCSRPNSMASGPWSRDDSPSRSTASPDTRSPTPSSFASSNGLVHSPSTSASARAFSKNNTDMQSLNKLSLLERETQPKKDATFVAPESNNAFDTETPLSSHSSSCSDFPVKRTNKTSTHANNHHQHVHVHQKKKKCHEGLSSNAASLSLPKASSTPVVQRFNKLKNVDKKSARTLAVTVKGVTVVITDYKLKPPRIKAAPSILSSGSDICGTEQRPSVNDSNAKPVSNAEWYGSANATLPTDSKV